jgi:hypothetical protein
MTAFRKDFVQKKRKKKTLLLQANLAFDTQKETSEDVRTGSSRLQSSDERKMQSSFPSASIFAIQKY